MEFKGTQGKWELKDCTIRNPNINADKGNIFYIAQCFTGFNQNDTRDECRANALLISKAPEMLEMLSNLYNDLKQGAMPTHEEIKSIEQLIRAATEL